MKPEDIAIRGTLLVIVIAIIVIFALSTLACTFGIFGVFPGGNLGLLTGQDGSGSDGTGSQADKDCINGINPSAKKYVDTVNKAAAKYGTDPALMLAQLEAESNFNPNAKSDIYDNGVIVDHAQGIAQFIPSTWKGVSSKYDIDGNSNGTENVWEAEDGIYAQAAYNKDLTQTLGNLSSVDNIIASYNAGPNAVIKHGGIPPYPETVNYVKKIKNLYNYYKKCLTNTSSKNIPSGMKVFPIKEESILSDWNKSYYGPGSQDIGTDIKVKSGTIAIATSDGTIDSNRYGIGDGWGKNRIWIMTGGDEDYYYAHLDELYVKPGQKVKAGDPIGIIKTDTNGLIHLHFGIGVGSSNAAPRKNGPELQAASGNWWINPESYLNNLLSK